MKHKKLIILFTSIIFFYMLFSFLLMVSEDSAYSNIKNFGDALWFSIVTIASVGYGDKFPITWAGKIVGSIFVLGSIFTFTVLISEFSDFITNLRERKKMGYNGTDFENHIIIIGWDAFAKSIVKILMDTGNKVAIITNNKDDIDIILEGLPRDRIFALFSDHDNYKLFENVNINKARLALVNLENDTDKLVTILNLRRDYPSLQYMVSLNNANLKETFESAGVTYLISKDEIASKLIASYIFEPDVAKFSIDILSDSENEDDYDVQQFKVTRNFHLMGKPIGELTELIKSRKIKSLVVAIEKKSNGVSNIFKIPEPEVVMNEGDYVIFINNSVSSQAISKIFNVNQGLLNI